MTKKAESQMKRMTLMSRMGRENKIQFLNSVQSLNRCKSVIQTKGAESRIQEDDTDVTDGKRK